MKARIIKPSQAALLVAAMSMPAMAATVPSISVHAIGDSLPLGSTAPNREYVRDFYGYGSLPGDSSNPGDAAYDPEPFVGWRANLQFHLSDQGFAVDMVGTVSSASDLPDTRLDGTLNPAQFTTADSRTYTYDPDHDAHGGWRIGGDYDLANINGRQNLRNANGGATSGNGTFVYTPGQIPFSTYDASPINIVPGVKSARDGVDVIDTGGNGLVADGANTFDRGIADHLPEMSASLSAANVVMLQVGVNDIKNREDVEGSGSSVTERVQNGNAQARLYNLILDIKSQVAPGTEIYVANVATVNASFDWNTTSDVQEAIEAFNDSFLDTYFGTAFQDIAGYTNAIASASALADPGGLLDNVFLVNTHGQIDEIIGLGGSSLTLGSFGSSSSTTPDYSNALSPDNLHWNEQTYDDIGEFYGKVIAANTAVPEPTSAGLLAPALAALLVRRRRSA